MARVSSLLEETVVEIERHVAASGWDQPPKIFALARTNELLAREPALAVSLGLDPERTPSGGLTPVEQEPLPHGPVDESLRQIGWPEEVLGCALVQEILMLPPDAEQSMPDQVEGVLDWVAEQPERHEARLAVAVLRDGSRACALRLRGEQEAELLVGADLAPNLATALLATLD
jgi:hypothetical protein